MSGTNSICAQMCEKAFYLPSTFIAAIGLLRPFMVPGLVTHTQS
jgi:hypothetical protein